MEPPNRDRAVSIFGANCYLLPSLMVNEGNRTCRNQTYRAREIGLLAASYDIVAFQEVWGSNIEVLQEPLNDTHFIHSSLRPWPLVGGRFGSFVNTASFFLQGLGGLATIWNNAFPLLKWHRFVFSLSETKSRKGAQIALLDLSSRWDPNSKLCVVNIHTDPMNEQYQLAQITETINVLEEFLKDQADTSSISVILIGDFNISSRTEQYKKLQRVLGGPENAVDLYRQYLNSKNITREDTTYDSSTNSLVIWDATIRIDFCWNLKTLPASGRPLKALKCIDAGVIKQPEGQELSDHWQHRYSVEPI